MPHRMNIFHKVNTLLFQIEIYDFLWSIVYDNMNQTILNLLPFIEIIDTMFIITFVLSALLLWHLQNIHVIQI